jgi:hypothetical protein
MNRLAMYAAVLCGAISLPVIGQAPAAGVRFRIQLVSVDTGVTVERDPQKAEERSRRAHALFGTPAGAKVPAATGMNALMGKTPSMVYTQCVRPDSGKWKRDSPACGPSMSDSTVKRLAESSVTADAQGHVMERLSWAGGDVVVELDASERSVVGSTERMRLKIGFWPRLAKGAEAPKETALRIVNPTAAFGKPVMVTVLFKDGAQILLVEPER